VFLDADRGEYADLWPELRRVLNNGMLVVDNATSHAGEIAPLRSLIRSTSDLESAVLPIGKGQLVVQRNSESCG
jgi:predicted O-methyltransferase YrrM